MWVRPPKELLMIATQRSDAAGRVVLDLVSRRLLRRVQVLTTTHGGQSFSNCIDVVQLAAVTSVTGELSNHQAGVRLSLTTSQNRPPLSSAGDHLRSIKFLTISLYSDKSGARKHSGMLAKSWEPETVTNGPTFAALQE